MAGQGQEAERSRWLCGQAEGADVLHIGCGTGLAAITLARIGKSVVGTETGSAALADARRRAAEEDEQVQGRVRFVTAAQSDLPFEQDAFDTVVLEEPLGSAIDLDALVGEAVRVLRPRGRLLVVAPWAGRSPDDEAVTAPLAAVLEALGRKVAIERVEDADDWIGLAGRPAGRASETADRLIPIEVLEVAERHLDRSRRAQREQDALFAAARADAERLLGAKEAADDTVFRLTHEVKALRGRERDVQEIIAGRREQIGRLEAQVESLQEELRGLEARIRAEVEQELEPIASDELEELRRDLTGKDEALNRTEAELRRARTSLAELTRRMVSLQSSPSYRLMRALWRINAAMRRPFRSIRRARSRGGRAKAEPARAEPDRAASKPGPTPAASVEADSERRRWLAKAESPQGPGGLRVAAVMDEMSRACFAPECELIGFGAEDWREKLAERQPHLLLVESCWQGNSGSWQYQVATYEHPDYAGLPNLKALVEWCREREIPTVFWNKEDPFHFDRFREAAVLFDHVLTTDRNCIPRYQALAGRRAKVIDALPFAAQPQIHNPIAPPDERSDSPCFAGAYYRDRHVDRRRSLEMLLDAACPYDLVIYDRTFGTEDEAFGFPERFRSHVRKRLSYEEMLTAYKRHKLFLNVNSVADSPTMFSRRVFELAACDTAVLSTESLGIASIFGDLIPIAETQEEATEAIERLVGDEEYRRGLVIPARRLVLSEHTYRRRLAAIAAVAGYEVSPQAGDEFAVLVLVDDVDQARRLPSLVTSISEQSTLPAEFLIGVGAQTSVAGDVQRLSDVADGLRVRVTQQDADTSRRERFRELAAIAASPWVAVVHTAHAYGEHHFTDLLVCTRFASADVIGAAAFATTEGDAINPDLEHRFADFVHPHSVLAKREVIAKRGWPDEMPSAWGTLDDWRRLGVRYYSGDRDNFRAQPALGLPEADLRPNVASASR